MDKHSRSLRHRRWIPTAAAGLVTLTGVGPALAHAVDAPSALHDQQSTGEPIFQYENVLGTSMELTVCGTSPAAKAACERAVLAEIDRLAGILSTYDAGSEISRVMRGEPVASPELAQILNLYSLWTARTTGAVNINLGGVKQLWKQAQRDNQPPRLAQLRDAFAAERAYNIDALGKGFIIDRAVEVARQIAPAGLLNIGGDLRAWGEKTWTIAVADAFNPPDNAPPAALFQIRNCAVATSGSYARAMLVNGVRYSHLIDPRTLSPITDFNRNATVIAADCVTGNAISTALCVLDPAEGTALADEYATGHLSVYEDDIGTGGVVEEFTSSRGCPSSAGAGGGAPAAMPTGTAPWPKDYHVEIPIVLKTPAGKAKRPYVVVWIEDAKGTPVRNIALWGNREKYLPDLSTWFKLINRNMRGALSIAAATRNPGTYMVNWDGRGDTGKPLPQGTYTVRIEINREHGQHVEQTAAIKCGTEPDTATAAATAESEDSKIEFKKAGK